MSDALIMEQVFLLFVEVDQFLVQQPMLQTSHDIVVFPVPILSSPDVVQHHILEFVVAKHFPRVGA